MAFEVAYLASPYYDTPDTLTIRLKTDAPAELIADGDEIIQWAQFRHIKYEESYQKVACSTVIGGGYDNVGISTRRGSTEYTDEVIVGANEYSDAIQ